MPCHRRLQHVLVYTLFLVGGCGGGATSDWGGNSSGPRVAPGRWVVMGSSTAAGVGVPPGRGWVDLLATQVQEAGVTIERLARSGLQTTQALPLGTPMPPGRPKPVTTVNIDAALALEPVLLLLSFPSNDAAARTPAAETVQYWQEIAAHAATRSVATVILGTQPRAAFDHAQRAILAETERLAAVAFGPCYVVLFDVLAGPDGSLAAELRSEDGDHLNGEGHARVHARIAALLAEGRCVRLGA